ncbi:HD domain-containing protein [Gluconobacter japonicus]|uniref:HD domain-containing protein n=1 Tax=Gluconobacter japonicus TaxID=376620 RepID=UPI0024ADC9D8|nr:HD domain-containing protein [Gluconobacter japonicus]MDI6651952.1 HD domain-containing protein [Gluconobacter japonicus]
MTTTEIERRLEFLREASKLKDVFRRSFTHDGQRESTAEHTWGLCLLVMTFADYLEGLDLLKLLKICILHDLGEAIHGDVPAISIEASLNKSQQEREDLLTIMAPLPDTLRAEFLQLWDEYENASSPEARMAKAFDKIETIWQHNNGVNPPDFDHGFNLTYGRRYTDHSSLTRAIRDVLDRETRRKSEKAFL